MDPNETLSRVRALVKEFRDLGDLFNSHYDHEDQLVDAVEALDDWLSEGGSKPDDWHRKIPSYLPKERTMDPNVVLKDIRQMVKSVAASQSTDHLLDLADELASAVNQLDKWLTKGVGFLPSSWQPADFGTGI